MGICELSGMPDQMLVLRRVWGGGGVWVGVTLLLTIIPSGARSHSPDRFMLWKPGRAPVEWITTLEYRQRKSLLLHTNMEKHMIRRQEI